MNLWINMIKCKICFSAVDDEQTNEMILNLNFFKQIYQKLFYEI